MEPEDGLNQHVRGGKEIIAAADVAEFVRKDGAEMLRVQTVCEVRRKNENRTQKSYDTRFLRIRCNERANRDGEIDGRGGSQSRAKAQPSADADERDGEESEGPEDGDGLGRAIGPCGLALGECERGQVWLCDLNKRERGNGNGLRGQLSTRDLCSETDEQSEGREEFERCGEPYPVAQLGRVIAQCERGERRHERKTGGLPEVVDEERRHFDFLVLSALLR